MTYRILENGKLFANEKDEKLALGIFKMLKRVYPKSEIKLYKHKPVQGDLLIKSYSPKKQRK
jgi:hypothetical protein